MSPNPKIYTRTPASHIPVLPPVVPPRTSTPVLPPLVPAQTPRPNLPPFRLIPPAVPTYDPLSPMSRHQRIITHVSPSTNHHHTRRPGPKTHFTPSSQNGTVSVEVFLFFFHSPCLRTNKLPHQNIALPLSSPLFVLAIASGARALPSSWITVCQLKTCLRFRRMVA